MPNRIAAAMKQEQPPVELERLSIHQDLKQVIKSCWEWNPNDRMDVLASLAELRILSLRVQLE